MSLFSSGKNKNKAKDKKAALKKGMPSNGKDKGKLQETKDYPNYANLSTTEAKALLEKRIKAKIKDTSNFDIEKDVKPDGTIARPTEKREKPVEEIVKPTEKREKPVEEIVKPTEKREKPVEEIVKPTEKREKPVEEIVKPTEKREKPVEEIVKPTEKREKPVEEIVKPIKKIVITAEELERRTEERRKKRLEASEVKLEKNLQEEEKKDLEYIEKANVKTEELRSKQKVHIEKLQKEEAKKEEKKSTKEERKLQRENLKKVKEKTKEIAKEKKTLEKEKKRENSFFVHYFEDRNHRFALSDKKYHENEEKEKEKEQLEIEAKKKREKNNKKKDKQDRKIYDAEILARRKAIIEREQRRARDMAKRREERIEGTLIRRKNRHEERIFRERQYIEAVAQREMMLHKLAEKRLEKKNRKIYYKSFPKVEARAKKEADNRIYQKKRYEELKKIEEIKKANSLLPRKERVLLPVKNPGSFFDRLLHVLRIRWKRILMSPVKLKHSIINNWAMVSNRLVSMIDFMDRRSDKINDLIVSLQSSLAWRYSRIKIFSDRNKQLLFGIMAGLVISIILVVSFANFVTGYEYSYNNRTLGIVKDQEDVILLVDVVNQQLSKEHEALISIDKTEDITFKRVFIINKEVDDQEKVLRRLTYMQDLTAKGYAIYIDGASVGIMSKEEEAERVLDRILNNYLSQSENTEYESVTFSEKVEIKEVDTKLGRLENVDAVVNRILTGGRRTDVHIVEAGETFVMVAEKYGISQAQLKESNPDVDVTQLEIGETLYLSEEVSMVKVQTVEVTTYIEYIPFVTTYEDDSSIWEGETTTKVSGVDGQREVVAKIVRNNGKEVAKMVLEENYLSEPTMAVVLVGTKPPPPLQGTGTLIYPVSGFTLTSPFGMRWGRMHNGVDLAASIGTKIRAADGGTVTLAGYNGELGYCINIDHGGNITTVYGHCSKLYVSVGDKVFQGQYIADVGSTGRSTGPHLHFEVRVLGVAKNPLNYL